MMITLAYSIIKKNLEKLYVEKSQQGHTIDQYIGRIMYEYEIIIDPEEKRFIESFFFYLSALKQIKDDLVNSDLKTIFPEAIEFITDSENYKLVLKSDDLSEDDARLIRADYEDIISNIGVPF